MEEEVLERGREEGKRGRGSCVGVRASALTKAGRRESGERANGRGGRGIGIGVGRGRGGKKLRDEKESEEGGREVRKRRRGR